MAERPLIILTGTYPNPLRTAYIKRAAAIIGRLDIPIEWVIVEDGSRPDEEVKSIVSDSLWKNKHGDFVRSSDGVGMGNLNVTFLAKGPQHDWGNTQRSYALEYIARRFDEGVVYIADDDNAWADEFFPELLKTDQVSVFPIGNQHFGALTVERPLVYDGFIYGWDSNFSSRMFSVDAGAFAFDVKRIKGLADPWSGRKRGGESIFLKKIWPSKYKMQPLCDDCNWCGVWHNEPLSDKDKFEVVQLPRFEISWEGA